ncbi:MAG: hypothetical protein PVI78_00160 [Anaerolineales bacterium]|jgi:hypothetical protein
MDSKTIGKWLFIIALILAIVGGFVSLFDNEWITSLILLLAFFGAYLWIEKDHAKYWMIMALALFTFHGALNNLVFIGEHLTTIFGAIASMFGVAVVALVVRKIVGWFLK